MKWYCLGIHHYRDWLSWGSSKQLLREWPEDPVIAPGGARGHFSFSCHKRMRSTVSNSKAGHSLESSVPAAGLGRHLAEARCLPGSLHRGQKPLHTRRHIRTRGRGGVPPGGRAGLHVSSSSSAPLQRKGEPVSSDITRPEVRLSADSRHRLCRQSPLDSSPHPTTAGTAASGMLLHLSMFWFLYLTAEIMMIMKPTFSGYWRNK